MPYVLSWVLTASYIVVWRRRDDGTDQLGVRHRVVVGGAACPLSIMDDFKKHNVNILHAWGMTETSPLATVNSLKPGMENLDNEALDKIRVKQGRPIFGVDLKIVDGEGHEQPWNGEAVGEKIKAKLLDYHPQIILDIIFTENEQWAE